jgi:hypothetical protein
MRIPFPPELFPQIVFTNEENYHETSILYTDPNGLRFNAAIDFPEREDPKINS